MEKAIYLLWRPAETDADRFADDVRASANALPADLARGLQLNAADSAVEGATMRIQTMPETPSALVSVWTDSLIADRRRPIDDAFAAVASRVEAYQVLESEPLRNVEHRPAVGERTVGLANLALLRRPADLGHATWLSRWQDDHTSPAIELQQTFGYVQNVVVRPLTAVESPVDGIVEELFPPEAIDDFTAFFAQSGGPDAVAERMGAMGESVGAFGADRDLDLIPTSQYVLRRAFD